MKSRLLMTSAVAGFALFTTPVLADCLDKMNQAEEGYQTLMKDQQTLPYSQSDVIRNLRSAARTLNQQGYPEACNEVATTLVSVIDDMAEKKATEADKVKPVDAKDAEKADAEKAETEKAAENQMPNKKLEERLVGFALEDKWFDTSDLVGTNVYNMQNEFLGEVDGLLIEQGQKPSHLIIGYGGFWEIGDSEVAIPVKMVKWDPRDEVFYVPLTQDQLDKAPDYDKVDGEWAVDSNNDYFNSIGADG